MDLLSESHKAVQAIKKLLDDDKCEWHVFPAPGGAKAYRGTFGTTAITVSRYPKEPTGEMGFVAVAVANTAGPFHVMHLPEVLAKQAYAVAERHAV